MLARHYIVIDREACDWAVAELDLGSRQVAHLNHLKQNFAQKASLLTETNTRLSVGIGSSGLESLDNGSYRIGHRTLLSGSWLASTVLLVENADNDGDFADEIFSIIRRRHPVRNFCFVRRHGGGSTIVGALDREILEKRIVVCLVDSDKAAPAHPESATVRGLRNTERRGAYVGRIFVTRCREVENHVPLDLIKENQLCPSYDDYEEIEGAIAEDAENLAWLYFDVKAGFNGLVHLGKDYNDDTKKWINNVFVRDREPQHVMISGFGPNILREFLNCNKAIAEMKAYVETDNWKTRFGGFFEEMIWFFAADNRRSAI